MSRRLDSLITAAMIAAATLLVGSYAYRTLLVPRTDAVSTKLHASEWSRALMVGRTFAGDSSAPVTLVMFTDLECPVCRAVHIGVVKAMIDKYPRRLRTMLVHCPLSYHKNAMAAAKATECVAGSKNLRKWLDLVFEKQDSLPVKSMGSYALEAGLPDTTIIAKCAADTARVAAIQDGLALGRAVGVRGTPTLLINGRIFVSPPSAAALDSIIAGTDHGRL